MPRTKSKFQKTVIFKIDEETYKNVLSEADKLCMTQTLFFRYVLEEYFKKQNKK